MSKSIKTTTKAAAVATIALGLLLVGCGSDSEETKPAESTTTAAAESTTTAATTTEAPAAEIEVSDAWARKSPMKTTAGAAYMKITSPIDDALVGASVDASIAGMVEIHETVMAEDDSMKMQHVDKIDLPAGEAVELKP
ncbi:MAG: copper chaperone PCu(A)C, partial [Acidimicrobiales bacterium]|nr:copper chaperone PCu(A)C [Acidimicrobiales bacterium]